MREKVKVINSIIIASLTILFASYAFSADWQMFRGNSLHSGASADTTLVPLVKKWTYTTGGSIYSSAAVAGGIVYFGSNDGKMRAVYATTGNQKWTTSLGSVIASSPAVGNSRVYFGCDNEKFYCLDDSNNGAILWSYPPSGSIGFILSSPLVSNNNRVYFGSSNGKVYCLNATTGDSIWIYSAAPDGFVYSSPAMDDSGVLYIGIDMSNDSGTLLAIKAETGENTEAKKWECVFSWPLGGGPGLSSPIISGDSIFIGTSGNFLYGVNRSDGTEKWKCKLKGSIVGSPVVDSGVVYVGSTDGKVYARKAADGSSEWSYTTSGWIQSSPVIASRIVYVGSDDRHLYALGADTGSLLWKYPTTGSIGELSISPSLSDGWLYIGSYDSCMYGFVSYDRLNAILGKVTSGDGITPINGALIEALQNDVLKGYAITDSNGDYLLTDLTPGYYDVRALAISGFISSAFKNVSTSTKDVNYSISFNYTLGTISGLVKVGNQPLDGAIIELSQRSYLIATPNTENGGLYKITNLLPGTFTVKAKYGSTNLGTKVITLQLGQSLATVDFTITSALPPEGIYNYPNPTKTENTAIRYLLNFSNPEAEIFIYNIAGELVRYIENNEIASIGGSTYEYTWDCRDGSNNPVTSGTYIYTIKAYDKVTGEIAVGSKKLAIIR